MTYTTRSRLSRVDKLYILAKVCEQNFVTPDDQAYMKLIIGVCTGKLGMSNDAARAFATDLSSAYRFDKWQSILYGVEGTDGTIETPSPTIGKVTPQTPTLNALKTFTLKTPCVPVKTVPHKHVAESETAPYTQAQILLRLAMNDQFNGVGRVTLAQARYEFNDKSLSLQDVLNLLQQNIKGADFETRPGNTILCYLKGKDVTRCNRDQQKIVPSPPKAFKGLPFIQSETYESADFKADKDYIGVGECDEDTEADTEEEE